MRSCGVLLLVVLFRCRACHSAGIGLVEHSIFRDGLVGTIQNMVLQDENEFNVTDQENAKTLATAKLKFLGMKYFREISLEDMSETWSVGTFELKSMDWLFTTLNGNNTIIAIRSDEGFILKIEVNFDMEMPTGQEFVGVKEVLVNPIKEESKVNAFDSVSLQPESDDMTKQYIAIITECIKTQVEKTVIPKINEDLKNYCNLLEIQMCMRQFGIRLVTHGDSTWVFFIGSSDSTDLSEEAITKADDES